MVFSEHRLKQQVWRLRMSDKVHLGEMAQLQSNYVTLAAHIKSNTHIFFHF